MFGDRTMQFLKSCLMCALVLCVPVDAAFAAQPSQAPRPRFSQRMRLNALVGLARGTNAMHRWGFRTSVLSSATALGGLVAPAVTDGIAQNPQLGAKVVLPLLIVGAAGNALGLGMEVGAKRIMRTAAYREGEAERLKRQAAGAALGSASTPGKSEF